MIYLATSFYAAVAGLQVYWDNSMQLTRFASQTRYKKKNTKKQQKKCSLSYVESALRCLWKIGSMAQNSGEKHSLQVRNTLKVEAFLSKDKSNLLIS